MLRRCLEDGKDTDLGYKIQNMLLEIDIRLIAQKRQIRNEIKKKDQKNPKQNRIIISVRFKPLNLCASRFPEKREEKKTKTGTHLPNLMQTINCHMKRK